MDDDINSEEVFLFHFSPLENKPPIYTMGRGILDDEICPYSKFFKQTLLTCLAFDPASRPTARELVGMCTYALNTLKNNPLGDTMPPTAYTAQDLQMIRLVPRGERQEFVHPRWAGDTNRPHGTSLDQLNFPPPLSPTSRANFGPAWPSLPQSPTPPHGNNNDPPPRFHQEAAGESMEGVLHGGEAPVPVLTLYNPNSWLNQVAGLAPGDSPYDNFQQTVEDDEDSIFGGMH